MYNITKKGLQNCTTDAPDTYPKNEAITITLTADEGYMFDISKSKPYVSYSDGMGGYFSDYFTIDSDNVATLSNKTYSGNISIIAVAYPEPEKTNINISNLQNCTIDQSTDLIVGDTVELILTPDDGFEFTAEQFNNDYRTPYIGWMNEWGENNWVYFKLVDGVAVASWDVVKRAYIANAICYPSKTITKYGAVNIYSLNNDDLDEFSNVRFIDNEEEVDLGNYVNRLFRLFVNVDIETQDYIRCGKYNTDILVNVPETDVITLDFGDVAIPEHNENITDYNSTIQLFLPFIGMVTIPNDYIGEVISLEYDVNIVLGRGVIKLYAGGTIFQYYEVDLKSDMIYKTLAQDTNYFGSDSWGVNDLYGLEPYVIYKWYEGKQTGVGGTYKTMFIGDCSGFNAFDDVEPITKGDMLADEQKLIYSKLLNGVYI